MNNNFDIIEALWLRREKKRREQKIIEGAPPLTYTAKKAGTLTDYRIYGQTENGESVGDLETTGEHAGEYKVPMTIEGKNLFSSDIEQGNIQVDGTLIDSDIRLRSRDYIAITDGEYTISFTGKNIRVGFRVYNSQKRLINSTNWMINGANVTFKVGTSYIKINASFNDDSVIAPSAISNIQIEKGSTALPYEPYHAPVTTPIYLPEQIRKVGDEAEYIDYGEQKQHRVRKNELKNTATSQSINGLTFMVNSDKSITVNGTATETTRLFLGGIRLIKNVPYKISGCPSGGSTSTYHLDPRYTTGGVLIPFIDTGNGSVYTSENDIDLKIYIYVQSGYTCDNLTFYPMIRKAGIVDDTYEPYIENTELDVTLPALPTLSGTNTLSVGTQVQPSNIEITGKIKEVS